MRKILIALIVSGALLVLGGVILGYYYPIVGNIVGIIGWILIFCFFILKLVYGKKHKK